jgi:hypothetical protein
MRLHSSQNRIHAVLRRGCTAYHGVLTGHRSVRLNDSLRGQMRSRLIGPQEIGIAGVYRIQIGREQAPSQLHFETIVKFDDTRFQVPQDIGSAESGQYIGMSARLFEDGVSIHTRSSFVLYTRQ